MGILRGVIHPSSMMLDVDVDVEEEDVERMDKAEEERDWFTAFRSAGRRSY